MSTKLFEKNDMADFMKKLDDFIEKEHVIVHDLAVNKLFRINFTYEDEEKLIKAKHRELALIDFKNSLL